MTIIYKRFPDACPSYLECAYNDWHDEVRQLNNFGKKTEYNVGETVENISFYFADSRSSKKNQVIVEKGIIIDKKKFADSHSFSYYIDCQQCIKITNLDYMRPCE
jgi:hypothetical protein